MKFSSVFSILIFLAGCQSTVSSKNSPSIPKKQLNESMNNITEKRIKKNSPSIPKKQSNKSINNTTEKINKIAKQLSSCQSEVNYFDNKTNEYFTKSIFLYNLKQLETIVIYYKDNYENEQKSTIKPIKHTFEDDFLVISEKKQYNILNEKSIKLIDPSSIYFLNIEYIDVDNIPQYKPICISVENRKIKNNNLFLYENKHYFHDALLENKKQHTINTKLNFKKISSYSSLKIFYSEDDKYFYLKILGCEKNYVCKEPKYIKRPNDKIIVFKFSLNGNHTRKIENFSSKHITRIQVGFQGGLKDNNHLVIESKRKKIKNITRMYFNEDNILTKFGGNKINNKQLLYRIEF